MIERKHKKKITFVTNGLSPGGSERVLSLVANTLAEREYDVEIVVLMKPYVFYPISQKVRLTFAEEECGSTSLRKKAFWLRKHLKHYQPDVVVAFLNRVYCLTIMSLLGTGIHVISSERSDPRYFKPLYKMLIRIFLPFTNKHVVQTEWIKNYYPGFIQKKTLIIVNPVNEHVNDIQPSEKKDIIVSVGRLDWQKNQMMMIEAFKKNAFKFPSYTLHIYGEGPLREMLQKKIDAEGMKDRIILQGNSKEILERMNEAKVFCLSSDYEGMSNAMMEALCIGLPIVTTQVSGVKELVSDGVNGYVVPIKDTDAFAEAIEKMLSDENIRQVFSSNNKKSRDRFELTNIVDQWEELIDEVISN